MVRRIAIGLVFVLWATWANATPLVSSYGTPGALVDSDANLGGIPLSFANATTTGTANCAVGSLSATTIAVDDASKFDVTGGVASIANNAGAYNIFTYTSITSNT